MWLTRVSNRYPAVRQLAIMQVRCGSTDLSEKVAECFRRSLPHICFFILILGLHTPPAVAQNVVVVVGSGSTVPARLFDLWTHDYNKRKLNTQVRYLPFGTGEGIKEISHGVGDFGAGEVPLTDKEKRQDGLIELPVVVIGIVPIYNLPGFHGELRLSGEVLAEIFLGDLKTWNAPQIVKLNPNLTLPNLPIRVIHRPAGKGSNYVLTEFLSRVSSRFRSRIGITPSPHWPVGASAERSSDMVDEVKYSPGSIGYVEYQYALKDAIPQVSVLNSAGKFARASPESIGAACKSAEGPGWNNLSASLSNAPGVDSFPISSFSWVYLRTKNTDSAHVAALTGFLDWVYTEGQQIANREGYAGLPAPLIDALRKKIKQ
jgi:phosphate transport system substrate-binding protein